MGPAAMRTRRWAAMLWAFAPAILLAQPASAPDPGAAAAVAGTPPGSAPAPLALSADQVTGYLASAISWYRGTVRLQDLVGSTADQLAVTDNRALALDTVRQAIAFARALVPFVADSTAVSADAAQSQSMATHEAAIEQQVHDTQAELDADRAKLATAAPAQRAQLQATVAELEGEIALATARRDLLRSMVQFAGSSARAGGLKSQIELLAGAIAPEEEGAATNSAARGTVTAVPPVPGAERTSIWDLAERVFTLSQRRDKLDQLLRETEEFDLAGAPIRAPIRALARSLSAQGDELAKSADSASAGQLLQDRQRLDALTAQFKRLSAPILPLGKQRVLLGRYRANLIAWGEAIRRESSENLHELGVRGGVLAAILLAVFVLSELWRRAVLRLVADPRRRYMWIVVRRFFVWFAILVLLASTFSTKLDSLMTFAGLITAGVAVALQNVILAVVGYFFLIGRYGIRPGDRIQIGEVSGQVIDVGLVRMHLMEYARDGSGPTGRTVALSNSTVFQAAGGVVKQLPGLHFAWHEVTLALQPQGDVSVVRDRLLKAIGAALDPFKESLDRQNTEIARSSVGLHGNALSPSVRLRVGAGSVDAVVRYPVDDRQSALIDASVWRALHEELQRDPPVSLAK